MQSCLRSFAEYLHESGIQKSGHPFDSTPPLRVDVLCTSPPTEFNLSVSNLSVVLTHITSVRYKVKGRFDGNGWFVMATFCRVQGKLPTDCPAGIAPKPLAPCRQGQVSNRAYHRA